MNTLQGMLEAEMDQKLGYSKYDYQNKETDDSRNGYSHKTVTSSMGDIDLDIPRDRRGEFEPQIVKKHQTDISNIEDQVLSMYAKGMTTRDISTHLSNVYGVDASAEMISHMTDRIVSRDNCKAFDEGDHTTQPDNFRPIVSSNLPCFDV